MSPCGHLLYPSCGCAPPVPAREPAQPAAPRCEHGVLDASSAPGALGFARCPHPATVEVQVHPTRSVRVCHAHSAPDKIRAATHVLTYPGGEKPDVVIVSGFWS